MNASRRGDDERALAEKLAAAGKAPLVPLLRRLKGLALDNIYAIEQPLAVGGQGIVCLGRDRRSDAPVIVKLAALPYHRPAYIEVDAVRGARRRILWESDVLRECQDSLLPAWRGLIYAPNPLHARERGPELSEHEPYLVMEYVPGEHLDDHLRGLHAAPTTSRLDLAGLAFQLAQELSEFCLHLWVRERPLLYADFRPDNILVTDNPLHRHRVIDAGSIVPAREDADFHVPFTWAYLPDDAYRSYLAGRSQWPTPASVGHAVGKILYFLLTGIEPVAERKLTFDIPAWLRHPRPLRAYVEALMRGEVRSFAALADATSQMLRRAQD